MLESIETRGIVLYNREFREDDKWSKSSQRSQGSGCFVETCGKITVESNVANL